LITGSEGTAAEVEEDEDDVVFSLLVTLGSSLYSNLLPKSE
jgi:hypothetical protein